MAAGSRAGRLRPAHVHSLSTGATGLLGHLPLGSGKRLVLIGGLLVILSEPTTVRLKWRFEVDILHRAVECGLLCVVRRLLIVVPGDHLVVRCGFGVLELFALVHIGNDVIFLRNCLHRGQYNRSEQKHPRCEQDSYSLHFFLRIPFERESSWSRAAVCG
jgi:hypothetical protein